MEGRILICTDLDRTLLPNGSQPESPFARKYFARLAARPEVTLAYVSGRHRALVEAAICEYRLPQPDWVVGDVGTTIYRVQNREWEHSAAWEKDIAADWRGLNANDLRPLFAGLPALRLQEQAKQNRYKLSYYLPLPLDNESLQRDMLQRLKQAGIAASLIYSVDETAGTGLLDVLPARATKLHAVEFLMRREGCGYRNTLFAGDSGNDMEVLASAIQSVLVANAAPEVAEQAMALARRQGTTAALYLAQGCFLGMNGNYSAGILEGVAHFLPVARLWLEENDAH